MEKRVILAFVLSFLVLYAFRALFTPPPSSEQPSVERGPDPGQANVGTAPTAESVPAEKSESVASVPTESIRGDKSEEFLFETPLYMGAFSNVGGVLKSFKLKNYSDGEGHPLELINQEAGNKVGWPLAVVTGDKAIDEQLQNALFVGHRESDKLVMEFAGNGLYARKTVRFDDENYQLVLETRLVKDGKEIPHDVAWQGSFGDQSIPEDPARKNAVYQVDTAFKRVALRSLKDQVQNFMSLRAGVEDQYFAAMFLDMDKPMAVKVGKRDYPGADGKPIPTLVIASAAPDAKPLRVYIGPKHRDWLSKADPQLSSILDYGYFGFIAKPLVFCLLWIHSYIGNFGWSIILLTVVINLVLFPLRLKQQVSMLKMQKIQPHMRRLQDQYKKLKASDPRRAQVQSEMMGLYKQHGVNPMGGCLPLLLQMPFLFAFYSALAYSIELRRAPWILWVHDLSRPDYVFGWLPILAVLMAASMFVQQKLTPTGNVDPAQAKMMMIMPLMFTVMFWSQSSGLVLYWLTGSIIGIAQQIFINKYWSPRAEAKLSTKSKPNETRGA
jgi:YidC/Oxa1 family membrane protein insertase